MARVVMVGGGVVGLCGALMLGRDGHEVTVLERDAAPPPDPEDGVERLGAPGRQPVPHAALLRAPASASVMEAKRPRSCSALETPGRCAINPFREIPPRSPAAFREADEQYER